MARNKRRKTLTGAQRKPRIPLAWPSKKRRLYPNGWPGNMRAVLYLNTKDRIDSLLEDSWGQSEWEDDNYWIDSQSWFDGVHFLVNGSYLLINGSYVYNSLSFEE